jgi:hypothetical protein
MANNWGPNAPGALGLEWWPTFGGTQPIAQSTAGFVQQLRSTVLETIGALRLAVASDPAASSPFFMLVDVIPAGDELPGVPLSVSYAPNLDEDIGNWLTNAAGAVNLWARIDDPVTYPPTGTDYIRHRNATASAYRCSVGSAAFPLTARVLRLTVESVISLDPAGSDFTPRLVGFTLYHDPTATTYQIPGNTYTATAFTPNKVLAMSCGEVNPLTLRPWTAADVREFDNGDWQLRVNTSGGSATGGAAVHSLALKVHYVDPDNRAAVGTYNRPGGALPLEIETDEVVEPDGAGGWALNWSKPATGDFLFYPRWGRASMVELGATPANDLGWYNAYQDLGAGGNPAGISFPVVPGMVGDVLTPTSFGLPSEAFDGSSRRAARLVLRTTAPADSNDSQPYVNRFDATVLRTVSTTQTIGQRITPNSSQSYLGVRFVAQPPPTGDSVLTARVHRVSDDAAMGGTFTITAAEARALPDIGGGLRYIEGFLQTAAALVSGTQYELRLSTTAVLPAGWVVILPYGAGSSGPTYAGNGGTGAGDCVRLNGLAGSSLADQDMMATLLIQPTAPAAAEALVMERTQAGGGMMCTPEAVDHIVVQWTATTLASAFDRYEVERLEDDGTGVWHSVGLVTSAETENRFADWETPRGVAVKYRVRVVATTAAFSDWRETQWAKAEAYGAELIFTSNARPDLTVVVDYEPEVGTDFPDHEDDEVVPVFGADFALTFINPRNRGIINTYRLIVHAAGRPCDDYGRPLPDNKVWDPLRAITRAVDIPYVVVMNATGNRELCHVTLGRGQRVTDDDGALKFFWCNAETREQQSTPAVITS